MEKHVVVKNNVYKFAKNGFAIMSLSVCVCVCVCV